MMKRIFIQIALFTLLTNLVFAQSTVEQLLRVQLPPLEDLYESAKTTSHVEFYDIKMDGERTFLKVEKKRWLRFFNLYGTYQYGVLGVNSFVNAGVDLPLIYQTSGSAQIWYNVGGSVNINLEELFSIPSRVKKQKQKILEVEKEAEMWWNERRLLIAEAYTNAQEAIAMLSVKAQAVALANGQYELVEQNFILGKVDGEALSRQKMIQTQVIGDLEEIKKNLNNALLRLEILSNVKIINK
jgi:hypothetical protein